jgi:lipoprotein NlpI
MRCLAATILVLGTAAMSAADDTDDAIRKAQADLKRGQYEDALKAADDAVKADPKKALAYFLRGEAKGHLRRSEEAIKDFDKAYELDNKLIAAVNQRGGENFKLGRLKESLDDFDAFLKVRPAGYEDHWRRGITLYYLGKYAEGAKQFKAGDKVFGNDVENAFWHYLCHARADGIEKARKELLKIGTDGRVPMMKVYDLIAGKAKPAEVIETAEKAKLEGEEQKEALFYAHLYVGLNFEAEGDQKKCLEHLKTAVEKYKIGHYMWDVANVHVLLAKKK